MEHLGQIVQQYRKSNGQVPPESYVEAVRERLPGHVRLGGLNYRGRWIDIDSPDDEILAYCERNYHSLIIGNGVIVLRLNGQVQWMGKGKFKEILAVQQSPVEIRLMQK